MSFLYPSFLWALSLLAIPVIIHLFNFRRTTSVLFSNTRFLRQIKEVTTAKRRLKHLLIMAARILFLLFLVLTFAQPLMPAREQLDADRAVVLYIDNSQSMSAQIADKSKGLEAALKFAQSIVELFPTDTRYRIITNDFAPFSNTYKTKPEAADILAQIRLSPVSRTIQEIQDRVMQDPRRSKEVFWISDLQKSTSGKIPAAWDTATNWRLIPIDYASVSNVFIDTAFLENPFAASGEKNVLQVKLRNDGERDADDLNLKLTINGVQAGTTQVSIPEAATTETAFDLASGVTGLNRAQLSFTDFPVSFDNDFFVALNFTDKISIIEVKSSNAVTPIEKVFGNDAIFDFNAYSVGNFNYSLLGQAELVIVNGLGRIESSLALALRSYLSENKGSVVIVPGTMPDMESYQQFLGLPSVRIADDAVMEELDKPDFADPFFENVFEERTNALSMPRAIRVLEWGSDRSSILKFKNDQPFLSQFNQGGKLYLMASPLATSHSDFFNHALFVPVMYRIASGSKKNQQRLYYTVQESFINLRGDSLAQTESVKFVGAQEFIPSQRIVNNEIFLDIPKYSVQPGFYNLVASSDTLNLVAFNLDKKESLLDQYSGNEMKNQMGNGSNITIFEAESADAFSSEIKERYLGKPLWKYALLASLFFLLAEVLLIRFLK